MNQIGTPDEYLKACDALSKNGGDARIYQTAELALYDVVHSLIHFMPHKNKVAVVAQGSHLVEIVTALALKNQNQIIYKKPHENMISFLETLDNNTHFVYWAAEHEITGEVLYGETQRQEIREVLNRKKIFSIQLTHNTEIPLPFVPDTVSYAVIVQVPMIFKYQNENSVVYYSEKQKIPFGLATLQNSIVFNRPQASGTAADYGIVHLKNVSALAIKEYLKLSAREAFAASEYPFWVTDKWSSWWPETTQPYFLENLLILSPEYILAHPEYQKEIQQAEGKIQQISSWKTL